jgi:hypothetical protein
MPGEVQQLTPDDLEKLEVFPLPESGRITLLRNRADNEYLLDCSDVSGTDLKRMENFYERMEGAFHSFRFESRTHKFPHCRFAQGAVNFVWNRNSCGVRLGLVVLPPYTT